MDDVYRNLIMAFQSLDDNDQHHFRQSLENLADLNHSTAEKQLFSLCKALWSCKVDPKTADYERVAIKFIALAADD